MVLAVVAVAQLMVVLDSTIVNIALPSAQQALGFGRSNPGRPGPQPAPAQPATAAARARTAPAAAPARLQASKAIPVALYSCSPVIRPPDKSSRQPIEVGES